MKKTFVYLLVSSSLIVCGALGFLLGKSMYSVDLEKLGACLAPFSGEITVQDKKLTVVVAGEIGKCIQNN